MKTIVYIGTWGEPSVLSGKSSNAGGDGVYCFTLSDDGQLSPVNLAYARHAGILAISPDGRTMYAANETRDFTGLAGSGGGVTAFSIDPLTGGLSKLNDSIAYGACTAYVSVSPSGKWLLAANHGSHFDVTCNYVPDGTGGWKLQRGYDATNIAVFRLHSNGAIGELVDLKEFEGHGYYIRGFGQSTSHIHSVNIREDGLVVGCNRGADRLELFRLDDATGHLLPLESHHYFRHGLAPRHLVFHPSLDIFYVCNENYPCVTAWQFDAATDKITERQFLSTIPDEMLQENPIPLLTGDTLPEDEPGRPLFSLTNTPSDIHIHPSGRFLYVSNRSPGTIGVFSVDRSGTLSFVGSCEVDDLNPRGFDISPDGCWAVIGLMNTNRVCVYAIDPSTGLLSKPVCTVWVPSPCGVRFLTLAGSSEDIDS